ncbi:uncharacterized protein LOC143144941 [Ptiloglossa arizonensis]|uniref:uncharacterized protein LOC143144941 n=1 Tax=Ptiloglossa arizonensis TaxID=3350558 RepID=UPI003F9FEB74
MDKYRKECASSKDEKLYTMEVFVDYISLQAEKLYRVDPASLGVDLQFADMPLFRIFQNDFLLTKSVKDKEVSRDAGFRNVYFNAGKLYIFIKNPGELVEKLRSKPLLLDVYRVKKMVTCTDEVVKCPLGNSKIPMSGCLCDHVMMASNDIYHLPKSYRINNTFGLVDEKNQPSGYIAIFLQLTCFGTYTINLYSIVQQKMLFKNSGSFNEFLCTKVLFEDEDERKAVEASTKFCSSELSQRDGFPAEVIPPNYPPKIIPYTNVKERKFNVDKARRKGFDNITSIRREFMIQKKPFSEQTGCTNISCPGTICIGKKCY